MTVNDVMPFRVTRNADVGTDDDEPPEDLVALVEEELRQRRFERPVRLEYGLPASAGQLQLLCRKLELAEADLYEMPSELDHTSLFTVAALSTACLVHPSSLLPHPFFSATGRRPSDREAKAACRARPVYR